MVTCPTCGGENPERARFCSNCGTPLTGDAERREVRRTVTILFCDVTGSTALGERLDAESLRQVMSRYFDRMRRVLTRHGGTIEKFIGDAVMAVFGLPELHEDDALRAVRAAWEMGSELERLNDDLERDAGVRIQVRIGVNTGEVVADSSGGGATLVTGDAVNVAARLQQAGEPGWVLLGEITYRLVRDAVRVEPLPPLAVKGKAAPLAAFRLLEVFADVPGHVRRLGTPLVGREGELELLRWSYRRAVRERTCHLVTVLGEAGVGKTRLIADAVSALGDEATVISGECPPYGEVVAFWPVAKALRQAAGAAEADPPAVVMERLAGVLEGEDQAEAVSERLSAVLGAGGEPASVDDVAWAVRRIFEALARPRPLVVVFEDLHWAEATFLDLVDHVADWSRDAAILLVCSARPELLERRPSWGGGKRNATTVALDPLTPEESTVLLGHLLGPGEVSEPVSSSLSRITEGNPLFVEELVSVLVDEGSLRRQDGCWQLTGDMQSLRVPPSIHVLLAARLDQLGPEARVLQRASIEGRVFDRAAVVALTPPEQRAGVDDSLRRLVGRDLIRPERTGFVTGDGFQFRHALVRDAAYDSIPKAERAELHERLAHWLDEIAEDRAVDYAAFVGQHLESAYRYRLALGPPDVGARDLARRAATRLAMAGRRALATDDIPAAVNTLQRAARLVDDPETDTELFQDLAAALMEAGDLAEAEAVLARAEGAAAAAGDDRAQARALVTRLELQLHTDPTATLDVADRSVAQVLPQFERVGDEVGLAKAWHLLAAVHWHRSRGADTAAALEQVVRHARAAGDALEEAVALSTLAGVARLGPTPVEEGVRRCQEALARNGGRRSLEARALRALGGTRAMQGRFGEARELVERSVAILDELGLRQSLAGALQTLGEVHMLADDPAAAEAAFRRSYDLLRGSGDRSVMATAASLLARPLCALGRADEAEELTRVSEAEADRSDVVTQMHWRATRARVLADRGRLDEAVALGEEAVRLSRGIDLHDRAEMLVDVGGVLIQAGRHEEAAEIGREALALCERKGDVVLGRRAQALLSGVQLGSGSAPGG